MHPVSSSIRPAARACAGVLFASLALLGQSAPPEYALRPLTAAEIDGVPVRGRIRFTGLHRAIPAAALSAGAWERRTDGRQLWRVALRSPDSAALRVHFSGFAAGSGRVWLRGGDSTDAVGPFTDRGPFGDGEFWSGTVFGDLITIEYEPDPAAASAGADQPPPFQVDKVSHQLRAATLAGRSAYPGLCELDVTCHADWSNSASSVGMIVFETPSGQGACSGALIKTRNSSGLPYFLTADHCIDSEDLARTVEAFWSFQTPACNEAWVDLKTAQRSPVGARYLVSRGSFDGDFSLLRLPSVPPGVQFADWEVTNLPLAASLVGIHHPLASHKRISFGERTTHYWTLDYGDVPEFHYYQVLWKEGVVEPGSSGSPLFTQSGKLAGVLSYGFDFEDKTVCEVQPSLAGYGRFYSMYPYLKPWLEDLPTSELSVTPVELRFQGVNGTLASSKQSVAVRTTSAAPVTFAARTADAWLTLSAASGTTTAATPFILDIEPKANFLARAGTYTATVFLVASDGVTRTLPVTAEMTVKASAVRASVDPNPVPSQAPDADGARWTFRLALQESAGVATQITLLRINGSDYTQLVPEWFGSARLDAGARREVQLKTAGPAAPFEQIFELAGVDFGTGQRWSQTLTVEFR